MATVLFELKVDSKYLQKLKRVITPQTQDIQNNDKIKLSKDTYTQKGRLIGLKWINDFESKNWPLTTTLKNKILYYSSIYYAKVYHQNGDDVELTKIAMFNKIKNKFEIETIKLRPIEQIKDDEY